MFKTLLNREKRENLKEQVEVVFAAFTIVSFVISRYQKSKAQKEEIEASKEQCSAAS